MRRFDTLLLASVLVLASSLVTTDFALAKSKSYRSSSSSYSSSSYSSSSSRSSSSMWNRSSSKSSSSSSYSSSAKAKCSPTLTVGCTSSSTSSSSTSSSSGSVTSNKTAPKTSQASTTTLSSSRKSVTSSQNTTGSSPSKQALAQSLKRQLTGQSTTTSPSVKPASSKYGSSAQLSSQSTQTKRSTSQAPKAAKSGVMDANVKKQKASQAFAAHQANQQKFKKRSSSTLTNADQYSANPTIKNVRTKGWGYDDYYRHHNRFYRSRGWDMPSYAYSSSSSFGAFDAFWMWMVLDSIKDSQYRNWSYHHRHDPSYIEWRDEADSLARENEELQAQLELLDQEMAQMASYGVAEDPNFLVGSVDPALMYAPELVTSTANVEFVMGAGSATGLYNQTCQNLAEQLTAYSVRCDQNAGSIDNLEGLISGKYAGAMLQSNVLNQYLLEHDTKINSLQATVYPEVIFVLANRRSFISNFGLGNPYKTKLYVAGDGAISVLEGFALQDKSYSKIYSVFLANYRKITPSRQALETVAADKNALLMFVCGVNCPLIEMANKEFGDQLKMVPITDSDLNDAEDQYGNSIFRFVKIPDKKYPEIMDSNWFSKEKETLAVDSIFLVSESWVQQAGMDKLLELETALWPVLDKMRNIAGLPVE